MKWLLLSVFLLGFGSVAHAQNADDGYLKLYSSLQEADTLNQNGQYRAAAEKYLEVQSGLKAFRNIHPTWNPKIVSYRLNYVTERLESVIRFLPAPVATTTPGVTNTPAPGASFELSSRRPARTEPDPEVASLNSEVRRLESEKASLEAKLREALSIKPAETDPKQLARVQQRVVNLQKEKDLLEVALDQERARVTQLKAEPKADPQRLRELETERDELRKQLEALVAYRTDTESRYQKQIKVSEDKLQQLDQLQKERDELDKRLRVTTARLQVAEESSKSRKPQKSDLKELNKLQEDKERLEAKFYGLAKELSNIQSNREKELKAHQAALRRVRELETERDKLEIRLAHVSAGNSVASDAAPSNLELLGQLEEMRAKLAAYESKPAPFTPEELALFKKPGGSEQSAFYLANRPSTRDLSSRSQQLVVEGDRAFVEQRFKDAEQKYGQVLQQEVKNVYALANMASAQMEMNRMEEAEHSLKRALIIEPNDPFSLLLMGKVKLNEGNMDAALAALSRSAQLNPDSAETQNYLGIVLSEKGQRVGAEAALRKAIQVQPDYASAHHNLSIIYATQKPPFMELARWHYEKAVSLGHSKNPQLEGMIAEK
ncbi:MAG: tetratricopeptide repeat protein [Verrucomicrobia bacterium]|nr:tetratricopeptide repeat protein [Verrucomicrobiota bacterium]